MKGVARVLSPDDLTAICARYGAGEGLRVLSDEYGIRVSRLGLILAERGIVVRNTRDAVRIVGERKVVMAHPTAPSAALGERARDPESGG